MCGICGIAGGGSRELIERMNEAQRHRGPDGSGVYADDEQRVYLGHRRLAILDLTAAAAQPMRSADGNTALTYNGEIYNYRELRRECFQRDAAFTSTGDTEVLLRGLAQYGMEFLPRLNGMFAFACWLRREKKLFLVRDPLGVKPLYYCRPKPGVILFASEIKALLQYRPFDTTLDFQALYQHLSFSHAGGARTIFAAVKRVPPGHYLQFDAVTGHAELVRYYQPPRLTFTRKDYAQETEHLRQLVAQACERQLVSDVPVGVLLSGGLDSSLITVLAGRALRTAPRAYTIAIARDENRLDGFDSDFEHARALAARYRLDFVPITPTPDVTSLLPEVIAHLDEPLADPAAILSYLIAAAAREQGTPVLLSGQGADELFCGYPRYRVMLQTRMLARAPAGLKAVIAKSAQALPGARGGAAGPLLRRVRRVLSAGALSPELRFLTYCSNTPFAEIDNILTPDARAAVHAADPLADCLDAMELGAAPTIGNFRLRDVHSYLPNHNLLYTDKTTMAFGVEARVPLLDLEIVNRAMQYPPEWLVTARASKRILRDGARGVVPDAILKRRKAGFGVPFRKWLRYDLEPLWRELTAADTVRRRGWFDAAALQAARKRSQAGKIDLYMLQWAVITLELWAREFLDD